MSLCHSLEERLELSQPGNNAIMMVMGGFVHALSNCLLSCGIGDWLGTFDMAAPMTPRGRTERCARAVHALCEKLAVLHHWEFGKFRRLKGRH